jgi:hypothetical protein
MRRWGIWVAALVFTASVCGTAVASASTGKGTSGGSVASLGSVHVATTGVLDEIPGWEWTALKTSNSATFSGSLSLDPASGIGSDDVLRVYLKAGEVVSFSLDSPDDTDFGMALWGPDALTVYDDLDVALENVDPYYYGGPDSYPLAIDSFFVPKSGYYYINPYTWVDPDDPSADGGSGAYTLTATIENAATTVDLLPVSTLPFGEAATIAGHVSSRSSDVVTGTVWLMGSTDGVHYDPMDVQDLDASGNFSFDAPDNTTTMHYLVEYDGTEFYNPSSARITVNIEGVFSFLQSYYGISP